MRHLSNIIYELGRVYTDFICNFLEILLTDGLIADRSNNVFLVNVRRRKTYLTYCRILNLVNIISM